MCLIRKQNAVVLLGRGNDLLWACRMCFFCYLLLMHLWDQIWPQDRTQQLELYCFFHLVFLGNYVFTIRKCFFQLVRLSSLSSKRPCDVASHWDACDPAGCCSKRNFGIFVFGWSTTGNLSCREYESSWFGCFLLLIYMFRYLKYVKRITYFQIEERGCEWKLHARFLHGLNCEECHPTPAHLEP